MSERQVVAAPARPYVAAAVVAAVVAVFWAPTLWRSDLLNWHIQTSYSAVKICGWPAWQEGFTTLCTDDWYYRVLERRAIKLPSTAWTSLAAHRWGLAPLFYALPWALHAAAAATVASIAKKITGETGLAVLAGLLFGLHPATAEVLVSGQFIQLVFGALFSALALRLALSGSRALVAAALALACFCDVMFVVTPLIVLAWVDDRRAWRPLCVTTAGLGAALHAGHSWLYPELLSHHMTIATMSLGDRLLRGLVVEPVLALRRLLLLWSPESGPWYMNAPVGEFSGLGPLAPAPLLGLLGLLGACAWIGRRQLPTLARLFILPVALLLADVCLRAALSDVLSSRWSGLRNVYVPAAFLALMIAWCLRRPGLRAWVAPAVGVVALSASAYLSWTLAQRTWVRMADDRRALNAGVEKLRPLALPAGSTVYLFGVADSRLFSIWQASVRDELGEVRFAVVTRDDGEGTGSSFRRVGPRELEVTIDPDRVDFIRPEAQPAWAGPMDPAEGLALYIRRGGQLNAWPIFDRGALDGQWVSLPGTGGGAVRVDSLAKDDRVRLRLRAALDLDDPRTIVLFERAEGWVRIDPGLETQSF
ncbi:MAG: hypothetical protein KC486_10310 [Myxococcales bacterium]|nr:hypothetical protein [Myxococcales bacterium]